jgi:predicted double-glycine peptidase
MGTLDQAMERLATDRDFRAQILENTDAALADYNLSSADRDRLLQQAEMIEAEVQTDPLEPTEADHGQADAAGSKD